MFARALRSQSSGHTKGKGHYVIECHQQPPKPSRKVKEDLLADHSLQWDHQVSQLKVQNKLLEVTPLEQSTQVWKRRMSGLSSGQLFFLARAPINCLLTPTSLARWNMKVFPSCSLCQQASCTIKHVHSCCKTALNQYNTPGDTAVSC